MGRIVGIDLGTSTSEVAIFEHGRSRVIENPSGSAITPSAVWQATDGSLVFGSVAYRQAGCVREFKRLMGSDEEMIVGRHRLRPEECSAQLLRHLIDYAESALGGEKIERAVITVPANWTDAPRRATETAGRIAGLKVERLINEPTAAAFAYGLNDSSDGKTIAVFDFGGGTFDVTLMTIEGRVFDVATSSGDRKLGGSDIDQALMDYVLQASQSATGFRPELDRSSKAFWDIRIACETAKKELTFSSETHIHYPFLGVHNGTPVGIDVAISRAQFNRLVEPFVDRSIQYLAEALRTAKLDKKAIDEVILVGGTTRIPLVRQRVAEFMGREPNSRDVNPDEAVALGAAVQAAMIDNAVGDDGPVALDIVTNTLGVETVARINGQLHQGIFSPLIKKGTKVPARAADQFVTLVDNQECIQVKCYQGEYPVVGKNESVGEPFLVEGLPPRPAGEVEAEVTFSLSVSGTLDVSVSITDTQIKVGRRFALSTGRNAEAEIAASRQKLESMWRASKLASKYSRVIERAEAVVANQGETPIGLRIKESVEKLKRAVADGDEGRADAADLELSDLLFDVV